MTEGTYSLGRATLNGPVALAKVTATGVTISTNEDGKKKHVDLTFDQAAALKGVLS